MAHATAASSLSLLQRMRRRLRPAQPDFADHGTAFGLELTLSDATGAAAGTGASPQRRPWWKTRATAGSRPA